MPSDRHSPSELDASATVYFDIETFSPCNLKACGAHIYAADPGTDVFFICYAVGDGPVETWRPGAPVPGAFANPAGHMFVSDNWTFERRILEHVLIPRYGFAPIPIEQQDCAQRRALASAFPAELGLRCTALDLPYRKDEAARRAMLRLSRQHKYKRPEDRERDLELLHQRCKTDVEATRACYNHPRLRPPSPGERRHYRILAHLILKKNGPASDVTAAERQLGKFAELAFGFGGSKGAWRKIVGDDGRTDDEIKAIVQAWRNKHPATRAFWRRLMRAALIAIRTKRSVEANPPPLPPITVAFDGIDMTITLPSGRAINYPGARLAANGKFEDGDTDIEYMDNAKGQWKPARAWFGTLVENVVQGTARDLLAAAIVRAEARWPGSVIFHCHDELVIEAPIGAIPARDVLALVLEPPAWAAGLPLGGKVRSGPLYLEAPETADPPPPRRGDRARARRESPKIPSDSDGAPDLDRRIDAADMNVGDRVDMHVGDHVGGNDHPHACIHCRLDPPDGTERMVAGEGAWLHPRCEDAYIRARMAEEGITSAQSPPQSPPASGEGAFSVGIGQGGFDVLGDGFGDFVRSGNGRARDDYPHGEREIGRKVAEYIYRDLKGKPYLKIAKYVLANKKKSFPQYHLENGQWVKGKPEGPAIPYRLPELLAAPPNATVEIGEGEKDADNLAKLGLIATTNPGGAGKWTPDLNKWFTGFARANIYEDNDEPGRKHAAKVARELCSGVPDVRIITFRELPEHGDVSDWLETGKTREDLIARAEQAPKFAALESVCAADEDIAALDWVWPGHFALKKIGLITGLPNEGKGRAPVRHHGARHHRRRVALQRGAGPARQRDPAHRRGRHQRHDRPATDGGRRRSQARAHRQDDARGRQGANV
jgi:hypothetical protein